MPFDERHAICDDNREMHGKSLSLNSSFFRRARTTGYTLPASENALALWRQLAIGQPQAKRKAHPAMPCSSSPKPKSVGKRRRDNHGKS
jgi:hypothetical protein